MTVTPVVPGLYVIPLGAVNAFLIEEAAELTLIDTGRPGSSETILEAVKSLGKQPDDIQHVLVTHCHPDHAGSLAAIKKATEAPAYMHPDDAEIVREGKPQRPLTPAPGLVTRALFHLFFRPVPPLEVTSIEHEVHDGDELPAAGGILALHVPGHCAGQLAFLWPRHGGVLFAADTASNIMGLGFSLGYENLEVGRRDLIRLAELQFEVACFVHGKSIVQGASERFRRKWAKPAATKPGGGA